MTVDDCFVVVCGTVTQFNGVSLKILYDLFSDVNSDLRMLNYCSPMLEAVLVFFCLLRRNFCDVI